MCASVLHTRKQRPTSRLKHWVRGLHRSMRSRRSFRSVEVSQGQRCGKIPEHPWAAWPPTCTELGSRVRETQRGPRQRRGRRRGSSRAALAAQRGSDTEEALCSCQPRRGLQLTSLRATWTSRQNGRPRASSLGAGAQRSAQCSGTRPPRTLGRASTPQATASRPPSPHPPLGTACGSRPRTASQTPRGTRYPLPSALVPPTRCRLGPGAASAACRT
mmetsp:Transcript_52074/g.166820  ORF Transcript_52074/g.166820 Transcript_52074/m.166820 type:complete len:217 (-) Transcript_52074:908-1558(-)